MKTNINSFLDEILLMINATGIEVSEFDLDHIAYSAKSSEDYEKLLPEFLKEGKLIREAIVSGRRVAIIKYLRPKTYQGRNIRTVELIEPKTDEESISGWEHVEFLVDDFDEIIEKYPDLKWNLKSKNHKDFPRIKLNLDNGMEVKFLTTPVLES